MIRIHLITLLVYHMANSTNCHHYRWMNTLFIYAEKRFHWLVFINNKNITTSGIPYINSHIIDTSD